VGLTGGIGSGKSTAATLLARLGVPVIDADEIAREVVEPDQPVFAEVVEAFGREVLDARGRIDRSRLRGVIFRDPRARRRLEAIVHPAVRETLLRRARECEAPYCILAIPLLVETGAREIVDRVLVVDAPERVQVERVARRDGIERAEIERILRAQASRAERLAQADDVLDNGGDRGALEAAVARLHESYLRRARGDLPLTGK